MKNIQSRTSTDVYETSIISVQSGCNINCGTYGQEYTMYMVLLVICYLGNQVHLTLSTVQPGTLQCTMLLEVD